MDIKKIIDLHRKLEGRIKQYETSLDLYLPVEVSNELRYALRAIIETLDLDDQSENLEHLKERAYHALLCAYHDLVDGLAIHISLTLDELRKNYLEESVYILGQKRQEIIEFLNDVNDKIVYSRENPKKRRNIYEQDLYDNYFLKLLEYKKLLTGRLVEDVVNLNLKKQKEKKNEKYKYLAGILLSVVALAVAILKLYQ